MMMPQLSMGLKPMVIQTEIVLAFAGEFILLFMVFAIYVRTTKKVSWPFFKAKLSRKKNMVLGIATASGHFQFVAADYSTGSQLAETKNSGSFLVTPNSRYLCNGLAFGMAYESVGATLDKDVVQATNHLVETADHEENPAEEAVNEINGNDGETQ